MVKTKVSTRNSALKMISSGIPFSLNSILYFAVEREEEEEEAIDRTSVCPIRVIPSSSPLLSVPSSLSLASHASG